MKIEHTLVLELLRRGKNRDLIEEIARSPRFDCDYFFRILDRHMVIPAALEEMLRYSLPGVIRGYVAAAAKKAVLGTALRNTMIKNEFFRIRSVLSGKGIDCILMKGLSLDYSGIRTIGDLDIMVREKDLPLADRLVRGAGFEYVGGTLNLLVKDSEKHDVSSQLGWNNQFQYLNKNRLMLELHTNLFERGRAYIFDLGPLLDSVETFWRNRAWSEALGCHVFANDDQLILMCLHTALKRAPYANTFVLRNLVDVAAIIGRGVNWDVLAARARALKISSFVLFSLSLAVRLLGADVPAAVLEGLRQGCTRGEKLLVALHLRCFHNLESSWLVYSQLYKILATFVYQDRWLPRMQHILFVPIIFPSRSSMSGIYHIQKDSPLIFFAYALNPFRWVYLVVKRLIRLIF